MPPEITVLSLIPDPEQLLALAPEELAGVDLEVLNSYSAGHGLLNRYSFTRQDGPALQYPSDYRERVSEALMEAWMWLEKEGMVGPRPGAQDGHWVFVTRRGKEIAGRVGLEAFRQGNLLPRQQLHPLIATKVWSAFIRGEHDVAVRTKGSFAPTDIGVALMRKAFDVASGPLTDLNAPTSERQALSDLFVGAIGSYKNPSSHRHVAIDPPGGRRDDCIG